LKIEFRLETLAFKNWCSLKEQSEINRVEKKKFLNLKSKFVLKIEFRLETSALKKCCSLKEQSEINREGKEHFEFEIKICFEN
jgi:hypothetical protein